MVDFWLDSNVFIEGKKGPYGFDIAPRFWTLLDELIDSDRISCPRMVREEILERKDELATWARQHSRTKIFVEPSTAVQNAYQKVAEYVTKRYPNNHARRRFLDRADPWVIAHAMAQGGTVVTLEQRAGPTSNKVKIPDVCRHFKIPCVNTYQMLRSMGVSWND